MSYIKGSMYIDCPNLRYEETKSGFLGFGGQGYYYCSCDNSSLNQNYVESMCKGKREYKPNDDPNAVYYECTRDGRVPTYTSAYIDCDNYKIYHIKN